ncbi:MAG: PKD domain-containing protein [Anaerolineae bacterium]|nr:PKD domain-containing protein [Anaerolineae bacterium]
MTKAASLLWVLGLVLCGVLLLATAPAMGATQPEAGTHLAQAARHVVEMPGRVDFLATNLPSSSGAYRPRSGAPGVALADSPCITLTRLALSYVPTDVLTATKVLFTAEIITGSLPATYTWSFDDGTPPLSGTALAPILTTTHTFTEAGTYIPSLSAWNECTAVPAERAVTVQVTACQPVTGLSILRWPTLPRVGQPVVFTATTETGLPSPEFSWEYGDGVEAAGAVVTHAYSVPSTYTLGLSAVNLCSQEAVTATLGVLPKIQIHLPLILGGFRRPAMDVSGIGYGASMAACDHVPYLVDMGFDWAMGFVRWTDTGEGPDYRWVSVDDQLREFVPRVRHVLLRVHHPTPAGIGDPPVSAADLAAFRSLAQALAAHVAAVWRPQGLETIAYEIWNEPNLSTEWGIPQIQPSAAQYTALLKAGYLGIKAGDPQAIVVSAGLATTGGSLSDTAAERAAAASWAQWFYGAETAVPDLTFLRNMYLNGALGYFDALGSHPYGGPNPPETDPAEAVGPIYFRRAEEQREVMRSFGDLSAMWATEFGWILETSCDLGPFEWMQVTEAEQAQYLTGAYAYAQEHWPWMGPMVVFNLDFGTVDYYDICEQMRYYSITYRQNPDGGPILTREAFSSLRDMPKDSAW